MKFVAVIFACVVTVGLAGVTYASVPDFPGVKYQAVSTTPSLTELRETAGVKIRPKPIVLPDVAKLANALRHADMKTVAKQHTASTRVMRFFDNRGRWLRATRHAKCWEVPWQRSCTMARASYRLHQTLASIAEDRLLHELPLTNDWRTAVRIAQRVYPGTDGWKLAISDREGGWGRWVWWSGACGDPPCLWRGYHVGRDSTGDTVGGWMQFRYSTFAPYWRAAQKDLRAKGYIIPEIPMPPEGGDPIYAAWLSPLGQALTAGYMRYTGRDGCHWCL